MEEEKKSHPTTSPKFSFAFGLVLGIAIFAVIGFFVLLAKDGSNDDSDSANTNTTVAADTNDSAIDIVEPDPTDTTVDASLIKLDGAHVKGSGDITLVEYSDFQCPYCSMLTPTLDKVLTEYNGKVRLAYKHYPLSFHANARPAALASECASDQGKFWEMHDKLFANQDGLSSTFFSTTAKELGLDTTKFDACISANTFSQKISDDESEGNKIGVQGTPATVLIDKDGNGTLISGASPYETFKAAIDAAL